MNSMFDREAFLRRLLPPNPVISGAIWALLGVAFYLDVYTRAHNVAVCFAFSLPIFLSLFENRPRTYLYACVATVLSVVGGMVQPVAAARVASFVGNRGLAILLQWLVAWLVDIQTQRLAEAAERAENQRRLIDIISHEVGTALTSVVGHANRLDRLSERITPHEVRERADKICKAAERIEAMIDRLKFSSSLSDGVTPIHYRAVNLHGMMQQLAEQLGEDLKEAAVTLDLSDGPALVSGDEVLLRHVFENVLTNSVKYSPNGGAITVRVSQLGSTGRVTITDRGSGIAPEELSRITKPYYRGENSRGTPGTGLGLYIAERIVEAHNGQLTIESEVGKGTTVVIDLPRTAEGAAL